MFDLKTSPTSCFPQVGKYNGLTLLLDAETYDYMYQASGALARQKYTNLKNVYT